MTDEARRPGHSGGVVAVIVVFAVICGIVLLVVPRQAATGAPARSRRDRLIAPAQNSLKLTMQAESALERANYGLARSSLQQSEQALQQLLAELEHSESQ